MPEGVSIAATTVSVKLVLYGHEAFEALALDTFSRGVDVVEIEVDVGGTPSEALWAGHEASRILIGDHNARRANLHLSMDDFVPAHDFGRLDCAERLWQTSWPQCSISSPIAPSCTLQ